MKQKVVCVFGTRPEAIKMAPVVEELRKHSENFETFVCVSAQHRQMLDQVLSLFEIKPDFDLNLMQTRQTLFYTTAKVLNGVKPVLKKLTPDWVLVQGDTTTTFAAALTAYYLRIPVAHIEAGLRTQDRYRPFPEEMNRKLTTNLATLHFAPTKQSQENLLREGVPEKDIYVTGNTVIDALFLLLPKARSEIVNIRRLKKVDWSKRIILVTGHRRESFGQGFRQICQALKILVKTNKDIEIIYPVHLNPNVIKPVYSILAGTPRVHLIKPLDYLPFIWLMDKSYLVLTDSGGIQEEAPSLGKPVLVMREVTERPEGIEAGTVRLVGANTPRIIKEVNLLLHNKKEYERMAKAVNPYGDGHAALRIVKVLQEQV
ncbi:MAG: UDP-N-acetylglucosamine 2-epimerase (non-hydrolyzing) [Candidatus Edwardsbacteria bacterium]